MILLGVATILIIATTTAAFSAPEAQFEVQNPKGFTVSIEGKLFSCSTIEFIRQF